MISDIDDIHTGSAGRTRRAVIAGAGSFGVLTVLAACASTGTTSGNVADPPQTSDPTGPAATTGGGAPATQSGPVDLGKTTTIPVGGGTIFGDHSVVITQPTKGTFKAFSSTCTHQGCTVASVAGGLIMCPCHGSEYSIVDGSVQQGPAPLPLPAKTIRVKNGDIFLQP